MKKTVLCALLFVLLISPALVRADMSSYCKAPLFLGAVKPNVLIILDTSGSMNSLAYSSAYSSSNTYYGYFDDTKDYSYNSTDNYFYEDAGGSWSGNFLNWVTMRRIDVAKRVLTGGKFVTEGSNILLKGQSYYTGCESWNTSRSYGGNTYNHSSSTSTTPSSSPSPAVRPTSRSGRTRRWRP